MEIYKNIFNNIYKTWGFGGGESRSGPGSTLQETEVISDSNIVSGSRLQFSLAWAPDIVNTYINNIF